VSNKFKRIFYEEYLATLGIVQASLALHSLARNLNSFNIGCALHSSSKLDSALACTIIQYRRDAF